MTHPPRQPFGDKLYPNPFSSSGKDEMSAPFPLKEGARCQSPVQNTPRTCIGFGMGPQSSQDSFFKKIHLQRKMAQNRQCVAETFWGHTYWGILIAFGGGGSGNFPPPHVGNRIARRSRTHLLVPEPSKFHLLKMPTHAASPSNLLANMTRSILPHLLPLAIGPNLPVSASGTKT